MLLRHPLRWTASLVLLLGVLSAVPAAQAGRGPIQLNDNRGNGVFQAATLGLFTGLIPVCPPTNCTGTHVFGRVIASPHVVALYWDNAWDTDTTNADAPKRATINAMIQGVVASSYLDGARQYGVGHGMFHSGHESSSACGTRRPTGATNFVSLLGWVECEVEVPGTGVPYPDDNTLYAVFLPDGVTITGSPKADCTTTAAFHAFSAAVVPDPQLYNPLAFRIQGFSFTVVPQQCMHASDAAMRLDRYSQAWSHELVEAATDPTPGTGWVDNTHFGGSLELWLDTGEAGDICQPSATAPDGVPSDPVRTLATSLLLVERYWSNTDHACVPAVPAPPPPPPPPASDPIGHVDRWGADLSGTTNVAGWVLDGDAPTAPAHVKVYVDGTAGSGASSYDHVADLVRSDVAAAYPGASAGHGFDVSIPGLSSGTHQLYVYGTKVAGSAIALLAQVAVTIDPATTGSPTAHLEVAQGADPSGIRVAGWAFDVDAPTTPLQIDAYVDGVPGVGSAYDLGTTTVSRPDVAAVYTGLGLGDTTGFDATIGGLTPGSHTVHVYATNIGPGTSVLIGVADVTVPSLDGLMYEVMAPKVVPPAAAVGSELTCLPALWQAFDVVNDVAFTIGPFVWLRNDVVIEGATASTYTPTASDGAQRIACATTATTALRSDLRSTVVSGAVVIAVPPPVNDAAPAIRGEAFVGGRIQCSTGRWLNRPTSYEYVWVRGKKGSVIPEARRATYQLVSADVDLAVRCEVTASNDGGSATAPSLAVLVGSPPAPVNQTVPAISGSAVVGSGLTCSTGTWTNAPTGYSYVWSRAGTALGSAMPATHAVVVADVGKAITCTVTASNAGGGASATSGPVIGRALVQCVVPTVAKATLAVAKARLVAAHCGVGAVTKARSRTVAKGRVIRAKVAVGSRLATGFRVALVVSLGR